MAPASRVESRPSRRPRPGPSDAVIRVTAAGLCGTDYRIWTGERPVRYPLVMGHEFVGTVAAIGSAVRNIAVGQAVAVEPNYSCGACALCREGNRNLCLSRVAVGIDVDGGFAQEATVPARCCWPAPAGLVHRAPAHGRAARGGGARGRPRRAPVAGETAAVLGVGSLGLLAVQVLRARGCRVLAVARTTRRLDLALALGADAVALSGADDDTAAARAFSGREGVDLVIETAGTALAVEQAVNLCRPGGRVVLTGLPHEATSLNFFWVVRRELRIIGSMIYQDEFPEAMRLLAAGAVRTDRLLSRTFPLDRIDDAFEAHRSPDSIKVAVIPPAG